MLKVINVPKGSWNNMEELLLEELEVFKVSGNVNFLSAYGLIFQLLCWQKPACIKKPKTKHA